MLKFFKSFFGSKAPEPVTPEAPYKVEAPVVEAAKPVADPAKAKKPVAKKAPAKPKAEKKPAAIKAPKKPKAK